MRQGINKKVLTMRYAKCQIHIMTITAEGNSKTSNDLSGGSLMEETRLELRL